MKLDKQNPTGYDAYVERRMVKDKKWQKRLKGKERETAKAR